MTPTKDPLVELHELYQKDNFKIISWKPERNPKTIYTLRRQKKTAYKHKKVLFQSVLPKKQTNDTNVFIFCRRRHVTQSCIIHFNAAHSSLWLRCSETIALMNGRTLGSLDFTA
jgi:hypothetical protein